MNACRFLSLAAAFGLVSVAIASDDPNAVILRAIELMPRGGGYSASAAANQKLASALHHDGATLTISPAQARPSYCSCATFLVFAAALQDLAARGDIHLSRETLDALLVTGQRDGEGVWGRWNANGPGTARLFAETGLGRNFANWSEARSGDFMKIWWTAEIGQRERGHSVIFLGTERIEGVESVRFWSSNQPDGYGEKCVPRAKIAWAVFSRLERPARASRLAELPRHDAFLASMLARRFTRQDVKQSCNVPD